MLNDLLSMNIEGYMIKAIILGAINFVTLVSFIINLCIKSENKAYRLYMHLVFWLVFNATVVIVNWDTIHYIIEEMQTITVTY